MRENFNFDFRTPLQKQRDERRKTILALYADLRAKAPKECSNSRIMFEIAKRVDCTPQNVRVILLNAGAITKRRTAAHK